MSCQDCVRDKLGNVVKECGPCEERLIQERISWWQRGKRELREREKKFSQALRACMENDG